MMQRLSAVTYLVREYDEAIAWFRDALGFELIEDVALSDEKRWVLVGLKDGATRLLLAKAGGTEQLAAVGHAAGGRVAFFLHTDDSAGDHAAMLAKGITFREAPRYETYGTVAVFEDLYGNGWDLIEAKSESAAVRHAC